MNMDHVNQSVEIGITIGTEHRQKGFAARAIRLVVQVLFTHFNYHRIWAEILETNEACLRLFKDAGFDREGVLKDSVYWEGRRIGKVIVAKLRR